MGQDGGNGSGQDSMHGSMMAIDGALVRELAELLAETGLSEIEVEDGPRKIRVARQLTAAPVAAQVAVAAPLAAASAPIAAAPAAPAVAVVSANAVKSPMVGTVYLSADPSSPPFVTVGKPVNEGDTLLIIEAMKVMKPIVAPRSGMVSAILVENAQPVEYDQPLVVID